jgi:hypothetical protein
MFSGKNRQQQYPDVLERQPLDESMSHAPENSDAPQVKSINLIGNQLVAIDQYGTPWSINHDDDDEHTFRVTGLARSDGEYFARGSNGVHYPISHELYGRIAGLNTAVDVSEQTEDGFYERRHSPTKGSIEVGGKFWWNVDHAEDYESARLSTLAQMAAQGRLAERALQTGLQNSTTTAEQRYAEEEAHRQQQLAAQEQAAQAAQTPTRSPDVETRTAQNYANPTVQPETLDDALFGREAESPQADAEASTPQADKNKNKSKKNHNRSQQMFGTRFAKGLIKLAIEGAAVVAVAVPATHTAVHTLGSKIPFVKFDQHDPMAFSTDPMHDAKVLILGPKEFVQTAGAFIGKVTP